LSHPSQLRFVALGGLGEFGMNLMVYHFGDDCLVVDAGVMFPGEEHLGIDVVIPDLSYLETCGKLHGVVLTHAHEDHVGALPYLLSRHQVPVYASPYTLGLVGRRLSEHEHASRADLRTLHDTPVALGPFTVEALPVAHSIPQSRMLLVRTPGGNVVHTADFKLDPDPVDGIGTDLERLARIGREGVRVLLSDSTNADRPGTTPPERSVAAAIEPLVARAPGRVLVTTFASHVHRIRLLGALAARHGRKLALVGTSLERHAGVAEELGMMPLPPGSTIPADEVASLPPERVLIVASGSQGEPLSALARIAVGKHRQVEVEPGDLVIHSARAIPGNGKSIARMVNHLLRRGAEVITAADAPVHVSGHAAADELRELLHLLRPQFLIPVHGEYRQLAAHARLAVEAGIDRSRIQLADSGDVIAVSPEGISIVDRVHVGQVSIDATLDEVDLSILRDRRRLAGDGIVVPVVAVHRKTGMVDGYPEIMARGFVPIGEEGNEDLMFEARRVVAASLAEATPEERGDEGLLRARIQKELRRFLRRRTRRRPLVIPVILEL
jgi:ribonuclease J